MKAKPSSKIVPGHRIASRGLRWLGAALCLLLTYCSMHDEASVGTSQAQVTSGFTLFLSLSSARTSPVSLQGANLSGPSAYIYTSDPSASPNPAGIQQVSYWLDNPSASGTPTHVEKLTPYDFVGTASDGSAMAWNVGSVAAGTHTITQSVVPTSGTAQTYTATFTIGAGFTLLASMSSTRAAPVSLNGATLSGSAHIFTSDASHSANPLGIQQVSYWLDDPSASGTPTHVEKVTPYDFAGTASDNTAMAWVTTNVANGTHTITQSVIPTAGATATLTATFTVGNSVADAGTDASVGPPTSGDVVQHHTNASRNGVNVDSALTHTLAGTFFLDGTFAGTVSGSVYAQPLYVNDGPNGKEAFVVATEQNHVTAIDASGNTVWDRTFGTPVSGGLPCGNISPLGITGTPYIDTASRTIYFDAMTETGSGPDHMVWAISLDDGSTRSGWPVDIDAKVTNFGSSHQNERGALQLLNGTLYVPYGGLDGDCDPYHGWVVAIPVASPGSPSWYVTGAARGGIWAAGSLPSDGTSIFAVTGNTNGATSWAGGEAVLRLGAGAHFSGSTTDYYAPSNWQNLDSADLDLGGANDFLLDMSGAPVPRLVVAPGKDQNLYLLNRDNLGGIGTELSKTHVSTDEMNAAGAAYHTSQGTYVALRVANGGHGLNCPVGGLGNLVVARIAATNPPTASVVWCTDEANLGSPMVTTTDGTSQVIVWSANSRLYGYDGDTGAKVYAGGGANDAMANAMQYFNTPIETNSRIAVATTGRLYLFR